MSLPDFEAPSRNQPATTRRRLPMILAASLALNAILLVRLLTAAPQAPPPGASASAAPASETPLPSEAAVVVVAPSEPPSIEPTVAVSAPPAETDAVPAVASDWRVVHATVAHSIPRTLAEPAAPDGDALSAAYARLFMWDMDLRRDLRQGDEVAVAYRWEPNGDLVISAASLVSGRYGTTFRAYRFHADGDPFPSYWDADGAEVPRRLVDGPLADYEQITSLLRDRPDHRGIDFKTPVGTDVRSPWDGVVTRTNWNTTYNGGCIEVRYDGMVAKFLHLSEVLVEPGQRIAAGTILARTGNTGRTTAPHLHYQLERGERTLDPIDVHGTIRRRLDATDLDRFRAEVAQLDGLLSR